MPHKAHYTAQDLAGLPGMPQTESGVIRMAKRDSWAFRTKPGRGGGREYPLTTLPTETRKHLLAQTVAAVPAPQPAAPLAIVEPVPAPALGDLKGWQTKSMDARLTFLRLIERAVSEGHSVDSAIKRLVRAARDGQLGELQPLVALANKRSGKDTKARALSERSLYRWWSDYRKAGGNYAVLAPKSAERGAGMPPWGTYFLAAYRQPQNPSPAQALAEMKRSLPAGIDAPSIHQVRRFIAGYSRLDIQRGRKTGSELRAQRTYIERDTSEFQPGDICLCDGHSFKAKVAHPVHGRPFKPEVCAVIDATTRVVWGWSAGLAESTFTVADAIRDAVTVREGKPACIPAILYTDNGAGNTSEANADEITGLFPRLGITFKTGRAGNPQGRGMVERLQATLWIAAAKKLPTFVGKDMDKHVARQVYLQTDKAVRQAKKSGGLVQSDLLMSWSDFLDHCDAEVHAYNRRPHSSLPRLRDPQTGLKRHMSPLEFLATFADQGWTPTLPDPAELQHLFRPQIQVKARRGTVTVFGNSYHHADLEHYHGDLVNVSYDIHDAATVQVRDWEQRLICTARFEGNKRSFFPVAVAEQAREDRRKRRSATLERHLEEVNLEARAPVEIPTEITLAPEVIETAARVVQRIERKRERKLVGSSYERYEDICEREKSGDVSDYELRWRSDYDAWVSTGKRTGLLKADEFCTGPDDQAVQM